MSRAILHKAASLSDLAKSQKDPVQFLIQVMLQKTSAFDLAPVILAYQEVTGIVPHNPSDLWQRALGVAAEAIQAPLESVVGAHSEKGLVTDYFIAPPSDQARADAHALRKATGAGEYRGPRFMRQVRRPTGLPAYRQVIVDCQKN